jgi:hypothetical protein
MIKERSGQPRLCYRLLVEPDVLTPVAVEDAGGVLKAAEEGAKKVTWSGRSEG